MHFESLSYFINNNKKPNLLIKSIEYQVLFASKIDFWDLSKLVFILVTLSYRERLTVKLNSFDKLFDYSSKISFLLFCMGLEMIHSKWKLEVFCWEQKR